MSMNYELAKELKDAGFPFDWPPDAIVDSVVPTLSELIEACGDGFYDLSREGEQDWIAGNQEIDACVGHSSEEAVARLWLALTSRGKR